jgi:hypothetical protein
MKAGIFFFFSPLLTYLLIANLYAGNTILLKDAQTNKQVELVIHGVNNETGFFPSGKHYGECLEFEVKNLTNSPLEIQVETGRKLICENDSIQNMMMTRALVIALSPNGNVTYKAYAMCIEEHDRSPNSKSTFHLGDMAEGHLLELAKALDEHNYQSAGGQSAVWTVVERKDTSSIWALNTDEKRFLRKYVSSLRGEIPPENETSTVILIYKETPEYSISGSIQWDMKKKGPADLIVYDEQGNYITVIFNERKFESGKQESNFKVISCLLKPDKKYLVRLKVNDLTQEELIVQSE